MIEEDRNHARDTVAVNLDKMDYKSNADKVLEVGDLVLIRNAARENQKARKLDPRGLGPR